MSNCKCKDKSKCCCPSTIRGVSGKPGPQGPRGLTGAQGVRYFSIPISDGQAFDFMTGVGGIAYVPTVRFVFPGTATFGIPTKVIANVWGSDGAKNVQCQIYDATNAVAVAEKTSITSTSDTNIENLNGIPFVWPATEAVMFIYLSSDSGNEWSIGSITIEH